MPETCTHPRLCLQVPNYLFFLLTIFAMGLLLASVFRLMMLTGRTQDKASAVGMAAISIWMLSSGFFVIRSQLPVWLTWLPFISPYFWAVDVSGIYLDFARSSHRGRGRGCKPARLLRGGGTIRVAVAPHGVIVLRRPLGEQM